MRGYIKININVGMGSEQGASKVDGFGFHFATLIESIIGHLLQMLSFAHNIAEDGNWKNTCLDTSTFEMLVLCYAVPQCADECVWLC